MVAANPAVGGAGFGVHTRVGAKQLSGFAVDAASFHAIGCGAAAVVSAFSTMGRIPVNISACSAAAGFSRLANGFAGATYTSLASFAERATFSTVLRAAL